MSSTLHPNWRDVDVLKSALSFYDPGDPVNSDLLHEEMIVAGQVKPSQFGTVLRQACAQGLIKHVGFVKSKRPEAKGRWILTYEKAS